MVINKIYVCLDTNSKTLSYEAKFNFSAFIFMRLY